MSVTTFPYAARIIPPRSIEDTMEAAINIFSTLSGTETAFDLIVDRSGASWWLRAEHEAALDRAVQLVRAAYPNAEVRREINGYDPGIVREWEGFAILGIHPAGDPALPLRDVWRDSLSREEADPLEGVVAQALTSDDTRTIVRLRARAASSEATAALRARAEDPILKRDAIREGNKPDRQPARAPGRPTGEIPFVPVIVVAIIIVSGWQLYSWYQASQWWQMAGVVLGAGAIAAMLGYIRVKTGKLLGHLFWVSEPDIPLEAVEQKLRYPLLQASIEIQVAKTATSSDFDALADATDATSGTSTESVDAMANRVGAAYGEFFGGGISGGSLVPGIVEHHRDGKPEGKELLINAREAAAVWHLPSRMGAEVGVERTHFRRLLPGPEQQRSGLLVGRSDVDPKMPIRIPLSLATRNHLIVAKTRRGKSTMLRHIAAEVMQLSMSSRKQSDSPALVVLDPHRDLATDVLHSIPAGFEDRVIHLDFSVPDRPIGINLIDVHTFTDRDVAIENIVTVMQRLWPDAWGPRMELALRNSLLLLYEANRLRPADKQYTILDVSAVLARKAFRSDLLSEVDIPFLTSQWQQTYEHIGQTLQSQTANPVLTKIGRFTSADATQMLFGQPETTFDPQHIIEQGGVLIIDTPIGALGEGAAAMLGATMMNLVAIAIESQVTLAPEDRRPVIGLIDESSTLGAINYSRMLSELGKFRASFVLVTQSLAKLDIVHDGLADQIKSNIDGITAFQTSGDDARDLLSELGEEYLSISDIVGLDDFHAYGRWVTDHTKGPPFSFEVLPPPEIDAEAKLRAAFISRRSAEVYGRDRGEVAASITAMYRSHLAYGGEGRDSGDLRGEVRDGVKQDAAATAAAAAPAAAAKSRKSRKSRKSVAPVPTNQASLPGMKPAGDP